MDDEEPCTCSICLSIIEGEVITEDVGSKERPREKHYHLECLMEQPAYQLMVQ